jgi:hypothetical protein
MDNIEENLLWVGYEGYADDVYLLGDNIYTIKKNTKLLLSQIRRLV